MLLSACHRAGAIDRGHEVLFCTEGDAEELLAARFGKACVHRTTTPKYYLKRGRLSIWRTVVGTGNSSTVEKNSPSLCLST